MIQVRMATLLAALTLALVGCSDAEPDPKVDPTPSTSTSITPTPEPTQTATPPTAPEAMNQEGPAGAKAFVMHFWEMVDYSQATLDIDPLRRLMSDKCDACQSALQFLEDVIADNGVIEGGDGTVSIVEIKRLAAGPHKFVSVTFDLTSTRQVVDAPGTKNDRVYAAATVRSRFIVDQLAGRWRVGFWEALD